MANVKNNSECSAKFEVVCRKIEECLKSLESVESISTRTAINFESKVIRVYAEGTDQVKLAQSAIEETSQLAFATAEHHPYWAPLYHAVEISRTILEQWDLELSCDQISEMTWRADEIRMALERFRK